MLFVLISEPDLFDESVRLNGTRIGQDFVILHNLLSQYNFTKFTFVGPDSASVSLGASGQLFSEYVD